MINSIFLPKKIKVGFQTRSDTYTNQLAYVIYYDQHNKLRKETSWENWRDKEIEPKDFENIPTEGFVLNKKVGDYGGWEHRQAYCRVYDPRGFEFEIGIENLLYILQNTNSIKGKGLEGEFVYGWSGKELVLMPVDSPDYKQLTEFNELLHEKKSVKAKDLILGATYRNKKNELWVYMCRSMKHYYQGGEAGQHYFFYNEEGSLHTLKSLSGRIMECVNTNPVPHYAELFENLERDYRYSPFDSSLNQYQNLSFKEFCEKTRYKYEHVFLFASLNNTNWAVIPTNNKLKVATGINPHQWVNWDVYTYEDAIEEDKQAVYDRMQPVKLIRYLKNGKPYRRDYE